MFIRRSNMLGSNDFIIAIIAILFNMCAEKRIIDWANQSQLRCSIDTQGLHAETKTSQEWDIPRNSLYLQNEKQGNDTCPDGEDKDQTNENIERSAIDFYTGNRPDDNVKILYHCHETKCFAWNEEGNSHFPGTGKDRNRFTFVSIWNQPSDDRSETHREINTEHRRWNR